MLCQRAKKTSIVDEEKLALFKNLGKTYDFTLDSRCVKDVSYFISSIA